MEITYWSRDILISSAHIKTYMIVLKSGDQSMVPSNSWNPEKKNLSFDLDQ